MENALSVKRVALADMAVVKRVATRRIKTVWLDKRKCHSSKLKRKT
jgi:hypothetical protein